MRRWIIPLMLGFGITLAFLIGQRMSTDAMAVVIGVAVGVAASVPMSVLLVALLRRERGGSGRPEPMPGPQHQVQPFNPYGQMPYGQMQQPAVIVINPGDLMNRQMGQQYTPLPPPDMMQDGGLRKLRVVGNDDEWTKGDW
jgi:hypothetical protein